MLTGSVDHVCLQAVLLQASCLVIILGEGCHGPMNLVVEGPDG